MQKIKYERLRTLFLEIYRHIYHHNDLFVKKNVRTQIEVSSWSHVSERKGLLSLRSFMCLTSGMLTLS